MAAIRERTDDDLDVCVELLRDVHEVAGYPINWPADARRRLLAHCVETAAGLGRKLSLEVVDNRGAAVTLYRKAGWRETGRTPIDWGGEHASAVLHFDAPGAQAQVRTGE